jgi:hypothetical protein
MTATIPTHCPHGAGYDLCPFSVVGLRFADGCWTTSAYFGEIRFWCGPGEASKPNGVSVTKREYLAAWDEAIKVDRNFDEHARTWSENECSHWRHGFNGCPSMTDGEYLAAWDEAENIDYHRTVEANDHAEYQRFMDENPAKCSHRGLIADETRWDLEGWPTVAEAAAEHAEYLGEVPWSDRVDD